MKFIVGFFMAWGNFITLPCPYKRWDGNLKNMMLSFLPMVGVVVGAIWMALYWVLIQLYIPYTIITLIMIFYIFAICGFMHLDGFMDCNDAILSRRPLEEKQRILKDSTVGAFAVVTIIFLLIGWYAALGEGLQKLPFWELLVIPVVSRGTSGLCVLSYKPIGHSQYVNDYEEPRKGKYVMAMVIEMLLVVAIAFFAEGMIARVVICAVVIAITGFMACLYARKNLGGMSGDIAGYVICLSEFAGVLALAII